MIAIVVAMPIEAKRFLETSKLKNVANLGVSKIYELSYEGVDFLLCVSGVGKVYAALGVANLNHLHKGEISGVINVGCAGSLNEKEAPILSAVIASKVALHDYDLSALGNAPGEIDELHQIYFPCDSKIDETLQIASQTLGIHSSKGIITSGDAFYASEGPKQRIRNHFGSLAVDMEAGAIGMASAYYGLPFAVLRVISDTKSNAEEYANNRDEASLKASNIALEAMKLL